MALASMQIYLADVPFDDSGVTKFRPALVIVPGRQTSRIFKVTTKFAKKPKRIQNVYCPIQDWKASGLDKPSWIDCHRLYNLDTSGLMHRRLIGKLSDADSARLARFVKTHQDDIRQLRNLK